MSRVLIDTSAWIEALRRDGDAVIRAEVRSLTMEGIAVFCDLVLLELWNGARGEAELQVLAELERNLDRVETTPEVWSGAGEMARSCRKKGITVPATDLLIAACAQHHGVGLLHRDSHFDRIAQALSRG